VFVSTATNSWMTIVNIAQHALSRIAAKKTIYH